jgi:hypothetical protein
MIPLIPWSLAESSRLTGTQAVNAKTISENEPPHQRSTHKGAIWSMVEYSRYQRNTLGWD